MGNGNIGKMVNGVIDMMDNTENRPAPADIKVGAEFRYRANDKRYKVLDCSATAVIVERMPLKADGSAPIGFSMATFLDWFATYDMAASKDG